MKKIIISLFFLGIYIPTWGMNNNESQLIKKRNEISSDFFQFLQNQKDLEILKQFHSIFSKLKNKPLEKGTIVRVYTPRSELKYGENPHQHFARLYQVDDYTIPMKMLNGVSGYTNNLDAINGFKAALEIKETCGKTAVVSMKHVTPSGAAFAKTLSKAFLKARSSKYLGSCDPRSSCGDFLVLSDPCDIETANLIKPEWCDGIILPGPIDEEAFKILSSKKGGNFPIILIDPRQFKNNKQEIVIHELGHGIALGQTPNHSTFKNARHRMVTNKKDITEKEKRNLLLAAITAKYAKSNSVSFAYKGKSIPASGQQNRVECTKLAAQKMKTSLLKEHPKVKELWHNFKPHIKKASQKINAIYDFIEQNPGYENHFKIKPEPITPEEADKHIKSLKVMMSSDGFFPFKDSIKAATRVFNITHVIQPGGSKNDKDSIDECNKKGIAMAFIEDPKTGKPLRSFLH